MRLFHTCILVCSFIPFLISKSKKVILQAIMKATVKVTMIVTVKVNTKNTPHPKEKDKGISLIVWAEGDFGGIKKAYWFLLLKMSIRSGMLGS